jgi:ribosome-associated protein
MIHVAPGIDLDENELVWEFVRASGPGGQNVNKVATAVQLRFNAAASPALSDEVRTRLTRLAGQRMTDDGILIIEARATRSQTRNREAALTQLIDLIRRAAIRPKARRKTRPTAASQEERLARKRQHSRIKQLRRDRGESGRGESGRGYDQ